MTTGLIIYGPDGEPGRRATPQEQELFDQQIKEQESDMLRRICSNIVDLKATHQMHKAFRAKGLQHSHTRSVLAWRMRNRPYSAVRFQSFSERDDKNGQPIPASADWKDWDYAPHGEGTLWKLMPQLRYTNLELYDVWVVKLSSTNRKRRRLMREGFTRTCDNAECGKETCALCWAVQKLEIGENESIKIVRREGKLKVDDPAGVNPKGAQGTGQDMGEDQRAPYGLTSTIHAHKKGASSNGRGITLKRDPADAKKYHR